MAKEKKRGFFSWLGFGQKEQTPEKETEVQNEQTVVEEIVQAQEPVKASEQAVEEQPQAHVAHYLAHTATERKQLVIVPVPPTTQRLLFQSG